MALGIKTDQKVTVWEVEDKGSWSSLKVSSSRKDKRLPEGKQFVNTNWFARLVGEAHNKSGTLNKGARIALTNAYIAQEPYEKDGEKQWPKAPQVVIFDFEIVSEGKAGSAKGGMDTPPRVEDDEIPWD